MKKGILSVFLIHCLVLTVLAQQGGGDVCGTADLYGNDFIVPSIKDTLVSRGTMDLSKTWPVGSILRVRFLNGDGFRQSISKQYIMEWMKYANLQVQFVDSGLSDIRIMFDSAYSNNSQIGTDAISVQQQIPTMYLNIRPWFDPVGARRHILHEFGHALGLLHEQSSPLSHIKWNLDTLYAFYAKTNGWTKKEVDDNVVNPYKVTNTNGEYDEKSIMHYHIPAFLMADKREIGWNTELSDGDKKLIAQMYPKGPEVANYATPSIPYNIVTKVAIEKANLVIRPSFEIQDVLGFSIKVAAYFFDNEDNPLPDSKKTGNQSKDGQIVTYTKIQPTSPKVIFNSSSKSQINLSLPLVDFPLKKGENKLKYKIVVWSGASSIYVSPMYLLPLER